MWEMAAAIYPTAPWTQKVVTASNCRRDRTTTYCNAHLKCQPHVAGGTLPTVYRRTSRAGMRAIDRKAWGRGRAWGR